MNEQALKTRIHAIAKEKEISFNECWKKLVFERFLARLSHSEQAEKFILKGGFLLAYMIGIGRETTDLDFLLTKMQASKEVVEMAIQTVISIKSDDGFSFVYVGTQPLDQPHRDYSGYRISLHVAFGQMKDKIQIDVGIGDVVEPINHKLHLFQYKGKPMFEDEISLSVYPPETIFAEKLETALSRGAINSRMKDYHDLILLARAHNLVAHTTVQEAIKNTFENRGTVFELIFFDIDACKSLQTLWTAHLNNLGGMAEELALPSRIEEVFHEINAYLNKVMASSH